jgi:hypothetical protein
MSFDFASICAFVGVAAALMVDGRRAVALAAVAGSLGLAPAAAYLGGSTTALILLGAAPATVAALNVAYRIARLAPGSAGLDPDVPLFSQPSAWFGPRSTRVAVGAIALPCASWMSFNVNLGGVAAVAGLGFPAAYAWICGVGRILVARSAEDVCVGAALIGFGMSLAWMIRDGSQSASDYVILLVMLPAAAALTGWLSGRHARRLERAS